MNQILVIIQLASELVAIYQQAQADGAVANIEGAVTALMAELAKPNTQEAITQLKSLFGIK